MAYRTKTLQGLIDAYMERQESRPLPSAVAQDVRYCSAKLYDARKASPEEFDAVMAQYSLLGGRLKNAIGLRSDAFAAMLEELKDDYYR